MRAAYKSVEYKYNIYHQVYLYRKTTQDRADLEHFREARLAALGVASQQVVYQYTKKDIYQYTKKDIYQYTKKDIYQYTKKQVLENLGSVGVESGVQSYPVGSYITKYTSIRRQPNTLYTWKTSERPVSPLSVSQRSRLTNTMGRPPYRS